MKFLFALLLIPSLAFGQAFTFSDIPFLAQQGTDWQRRVVANGGAMPSASTIACMENLRLTLIAQGITNKIWSLCVFVPDSVIAASTPLFLHKGYPMWTNSGFVSGDLNINGLAGDGTSFLDTGVIASSVQTNANNITTNVGITAIVTESATNQANGIVMNQIFLPANHSIGLFASGAGVSQFYAGAVQADQFINTNDFGRVGYISGQHLFTTNALFVASPLESHKLLAAGPGTTSSLEQFNSTLTFFGTRIQNTNNSANYLRLSVGMLHEGFTQTESSNVWWALKTCRECLGGGTGDPIHDYNLTVTRGGGADISSTTSNALRTFRQGMDTDAILYQIAVANAYVPDNLTAARTPVLWQAGSQIWTNVAFGTSNLTVNGLAGNTTTKSLGIGLNASTLNYGGFSDTSAGISMMIYSATNTAASAVVEFGTAPHTASGGFYLLHFGATLFFNCWRVINVNTDFIARTAPAGGSNWSGYISGNRTAANAIAMYVGTNTVFQLWTNASGSTVSVNNDMTNSIAHALYVSAIAVPAAANWSDRTVSFLAVHPGHTITQNSNLWNRVRDLRTSLGGGVP